MSTRMQSSGKYSVPEPDLPNIEAKYPDPVSGGKCLLVEINCHSLNRNRGQNVVSQRYAVNFKFSSMPKNILAEISEMSIIDLFPNNFLRFRLCYLPLSVPAAKHAFSLQKQVKNYQRSRMTLEWTLSINCEMDRKLGCTTIIHDFADKTKEIVAILQTAVVN